MIRIQPLAQLDASAEVARQLQHLAWAEIATAVGIVVLAVLGIGLAVMTFSTLRALGRLLFAVERIVDRLAPQAEPLVQRAVTLADDATAITRSVRDEVERTRRTLDELNRQVRNAADSAGERVRHFGAVLDAVQNEVEDLLLDATATARGIYVTAEALGRPAAPPRREPKGADGE